MKRAEWERRVGEHYRAEIQLFKLRPWEVAPVWFHVGDPPDPSDTTARGASWAKAAALRDQLLAANPKHYSNLED